MHYIKLFPFSERTYFIWILKIQSQLPNQMVTQKSASISSYYYYLSPRRIVRLIRNIFIDLQFGKFLGGMKRTPYSHLGYIDSINTDYGALRQIFEGKVSPEDVLVDVGCGKGRVLNWWLKHFSNNSIYGIENDAELALGVARRLRRFPNVKIITGDVFDHWPEDGSLFYLFNPFNRKLTEKFRDRLIRTNGVARATGRAIRIIYYYPASLDVFEENDRFLIEDLEVKSPHFRAVMITYLGQSREECLIGE